ncbi:MAG: putative lipase [Nocardioides sp.]|nr:putative lipase [Nocardioides sp.]
MTLHPQAAALIESIGNAETPPLSQQTVAEARRGAYGFRDLFGPPQPVASVEHHFVPGPTADLPVRVYRPQTARDGVAPALVYFHGSGFVISNIGIFDSPTRALANRTGCVVVAVNYQKAPEHPFPVPFDDAYAATQWVVDNAGALGIDPDRVGVIGDSAGGTLAAAVCLKARDVDGPAIATQVLVHVPTQFGVETPSMRENATGLLLEADDMRWFAEHYLRREDDRTHPYAAPMAATSLAGLPPALVVTAQYDVLRDDGAAYARRLREDGVPVTYSCYPGMIHAFYGMTSQLDAASELYDEISAHVRQYLTGAEPTPERST